MAAAEFGQEYFAALLDRLQGAGEFLNLPSWLDPNKEFIQAGGIDPGSITQEELTQREDELSRMMAVYFGKEQRSFGRYLEFFADNLAKRVDYQDALNIALGNMMHQFSDGIKRMDDPGRPDVEYLRGGIIEVILEGILKRDSMPKLPENDLGTGKSVSAVNRILGSDPILDKAEDYPEIVLAVAVYQAAHIAYLEEFDAALDRNEKLEEGNEKKLLPEELKNARYVIKEPFRQFYEFIIFRGGILTLFLLMADKIKHDGGMDGKDRVSGLQKAITEGWPLVHNPLHLLRTRDFVAAGGGHLSAFCPAAGLMAQAQRDGYLEGLVGKFDNDPDTFGKFIERAKETAHSATEAARRRVYIESNVSRQFFPHLGDGMVEITHEGPGNVEIDFAEHIVAMNGTTRLVIKQGEKTIEIKAIPGKEASIEIEDGAPVLRNGIMTVDGVRVADHGTRLSDVLSPNRFFTNAIGTEIERSSRAIRRAIADSARGIEKINGGNPLEEIKPASIDGAPTFVVPVGGGSTRGR